MTSSHANLRNTCGILAIAAVAVATVFPPTSHADIIQQVETVWRSDVPPEFFIANASFHSPPDVPHHILALLSGNGYQGIAAAGEFGNVGVSGLQFAHGSLQTHVVVTNTYIPNLFGTNMHASALFVIDGGSLAALGGDAGVDFTLDVSADVLGPDGSLLNSQTFFSRASLSSVDFELPTLQLSGDDMGIHIDSNNPIQAVIPTSFQELDIGVVPPNGSIRLGYRVDVNGHSRGVAEGISWLFSDPFNVSGTGEFPAVSFSAVPEPNAWYAVAMMLALAWCNLRIRKRRSLVGFAHR